MLVRESLHCSHLFSAGHPTELTLRGPGTALQECGAIFRLFVLMLCHRPVHTQTHIVSCSALTLSLVSNTAEVRGNHVSLSYTSTWVPSLPRTPPICFVAKLPVIYVSWCVSVCLCLRTNCPHRRALTVRTRLNVPDLVFPPAPSIFHDTGQSGRCGVFLAVSCTTPSFFSHYL